MDEGFIGVWTGRSDAGGWMDGRKEEWMDGWIADLCASTV